MNHPKDGFASKRDAADWALGHYGKLSKKTGAEYGGYIAQDGERWRVGPVMEGDAYSTDVIGGKRDDDFVVGYWHTHPDNSPMSWKRAKDGVSDSDVGVHDVATRADPVDGPSAELQNPNSLSPTEREEWRQTFSSYVVDANGRVTAIHGPFDAEALGAFRQQEIEAANGPSKQLRGVTPEAQHMQNGATKRSKRCRGVYIGVFMVRGSSFILIMTLLGCTRPPEPEPLGRQCNELFVTCVEACETVEDCRTEAIRPNAGCYVACQRAEDMSASILDFRSRRPTDCSPPYTGAYQLFLPQVASALLRELSADVRWISVERAENRWNIHVGLDRASVATETRIRRALEKAPGVYPSPMPLECSFVVGDESSAVGFLLYVRAPDVKTTGPDPAIGPDPEVSRRD